MATVNIDIQDGNAATVDKDGLWTCERIAVVSGLTGTVHQRIYQAAQQPGIPRVNSRHPSIPRVYLRSIRGASESPTAVRLRMEYGPRDEDEGTSEGGTSITVGATLQPVIEDEDIHGDKFEVTGPENKVQRKNLTVDRPHVTLSFRRKEYIFPGDKAKAYVGRINKGQWAVDRTATEGEWRCNAITGSSNNGGRSWDTAYEFESDAKHQWRTKGAYQDESGNTPENAGEDAVKYFDTYKKKNFNALRLI